MLSHLKRYKSKRIWPSLIRGGLVVAAALLAAAHANAQITISVNVTANRLAINPNIYGIGATPTTSVLQDLNCPLNRDGGNPTSEYNWQANAYNTDFDWYFESAQLTGGATAGAWVDGMVSSCNAAKTSLMVTIPMLPYVATTGAGGATLGSFSVAKYGPQTSSDGDHGNGISTASGNPFITGNNPLDAYVPNSPALQLSWMQHLTNTWGTAANGGITYYVMDNEQSIWHSVHRDVHPIGATEHEILNDITAYSGEVKANDPSALVVAPEEWGWTGYQYSGFDQQYCGVNGFANPPDRDSNGGLAYVPWLLQNLKAYDTAHGTKSIDVFSLHWYPQSGEYSNDDSPATQTLRNESTRSLWDPTYTDVSWIDAVVQLIPLMKSWVATYYPGLKTAITEYNWGDEANMNGATTLADVLGIFGAQGLDMATYWICPATNSPAYLARKIYRNYDGNDSTFGDTCVSCSGFSPDSQTAYAAQRTSDNAVTVMMINKITSATAATINLSNFTAGPTAHRYQISSNTQTSITPLTDITVTGGSTISDTLPAQSITLYVIPKSSGGSAPPTPSGLTATGGNAQVSLSWSASAGATSYNVSQSTVSGSGYTSVATGVTTTSYTDVGLINGVTYYFVVSASNQSGSSNNSNQASATPTGPPPAPSGLIAAPGSTQVALTWNPSPSATTYGVLRSTVSGSGYASVTSGLTTTYYTNSGLTNGTTYYYVVTASNSFGTSGNSSPAAVTPVAGGLPLANASFEAPALGAGAYQYNPTGGTWTFAADSGIVSNGSAFGNPNAPNGVQAALLQENGSDVGAISQSVIFTAGTDTVSFQACQRSYGGQNNQSINVYIDSTLVGTITPTSTSYALYTTPSFSVTSGPHTLQFVGGNAAGDNTAFLDSVAINSVGGSAPPAPTGLTATPGNSQASLTWGASTGATSYNVLRSTVSGSGYAGVTTGLSTTAYTNTGLTNGTTYYFVVTAVNSSGTSANSNQASATPEPAAPAAPTGLTASAGSGQVAIAWTASSGATSYNVLRSTVSGSGYASVTTGLSTTTYTNTGLTNGTTYYYVVTAVNAGGTSGNSNQAGATPVAGGGALTNASFETPVLTSGTYQYNPTGGTWTFASDSGIAGNGSGFGNPTAPNGVQVAFLQENGSLVGAISQSVTLAAGSYTVSFQACQRAYPSQNNQSINVYLDSTLEGAITPTSESFALYTTPAFTAPAGTHTLEFLGGNASGDNTAFIDSVAINSVGGSAPPAPTGLTATPGNAQVALTWTASSGATSYNVLRSTTSGSGYASVITGVATTGYTNTGLTNGTTYYFVVAAVNSAGTSGNSNQAAATPQVPAPPAPTGLTATAGSAQVALAWTASTGATSYNVLRSTVNGSGYVTVTTGVTTTAYTNTGLTNGATYYFVVAAVNPGGTSGNSSQASASPSAGVALANASFETPALGSGVYQYNPTGGTWTFASDSGIANNGSGFGNPSAPNGVQVAFLQENGSLVGAISQSVTFTAGTHTVSMQACQRAYPSQNSQSINVYIDTTLVGTITPTSTSFALYTTPGFSVTAGAHTLEFLGGNAPGDNTAFIDSVVIN